MTTDFNKNKEINKARPCADAIYCHPCITGTVKIAFTPFTLGQTQEFVGYDKSMIGTLYQYNKHPPIIKNKSVDIGCKANHNGINTFKPMGIGYGILRKDCLIASPKELLSLL